MSQAQLEPTILQYEQKSLNESSLKCFWMALFMQLYYFVDLDMKCNRHCKSHEQLDKKWPQVSAYFWDVQFPTCYRMSYCFPFADISYIKILVRLSLQQTLVNSWIFIIHVRIRL